MIERTIVHVLQELNEEEPVLHSNPESVRQAKRAQMVPLRRIRSNALRRIAKDSLLTITRGDRCLAIGKLNEAGRFIDECLTVERMLLVSESTEDARSIEEFRSSFPFEV